MPVHKYTPILMEFHDFHSNAEKIPKSWKDWDGDQHLKTPFENKQEMITNEKFQILLIQENMSSFDNQCSPGINTSIFSSC